MPSTHTGAATRRMADPLPQEAAGGKPAIYPDILATIGNTPIVRINKLAPNHVNVFAKLESFNPLGSVKDRLALGIIEAAERDGSLRPGQTVVEATSGNTGIGLAMVCAQKGYPLVIVMAENFSVERRRLMRFLGAKVVLTPAAEKGSGMLKKAIELADRHGWFLCRQFSNDANADTHSATTAQEILAAFPQETLHYFVSGFGTGGTLKGVARVLRAQSPGTRIVATEPDNSPLLGSGVAQAFDADHLPRGSHPSFRPHPMQGWSPDFISRLTQDAVEAKLIDEVIGVNGGEAMRLARELATQEGIFCGTSSGATFAGALAVSRRAPPGANILCILPDTGERYLSTPLFDDISAEMSEEERALADSTPGYRFGVPAAAGPVASVLPVPTAAAVEFVNDAISRADKPVVMFALAWCEFCWSVRKLLKALDIDYRSIDLDSVEFQEGNLGGEIRTALRPLTNASTIPQIFIGGEHFGGCTDFFDAYRQGRVQAKLRALGIAFRQDDTLDPYGFLPKWLSKR